MKTNNPTNTGRKVAPILFILTTLLFLSTAASAANITKTDNITIRVEVAELTLVDVNPNEINFTQVNPGSYSGDQYFQIENVGSTNISYVWFNVTQPSSRPFATGSVTAYNAGNFVQIRQNTSGAVMYFVDRLEFNETTLIYQTYDTVSPTNGGNITHGRFRIANQEYFWQVENNSVGNCSTGTFTIGKSAHNITNLGTVDMTATCDSLNEQGGANDCREDTLHNADGTYADSWGVMDVVVGNGNQGQSKWNYTVAVNANCTTVRFFVWNMDAPGAYDDDINWTNYFVNSTDVLTPGENIIGDIRVAVPYGTHSGNVTEGLLTVIALAMDVTA